jgi:hypothetical protein
MSGEQKAKEDTIAHRVDSLRTRFPLTVCAIISGAEAICSRLDCLIDETAKAAYALDQINRFGAGPE